MENINIYPVRSVTRSYSRSVSHAAYGADKTDIFQSLSYSWMEEPTDEEVQQKSEELYQECKRQVEQEMQEKIKEYNDGKTAKQNQETKDLPF